MSNNNYILFLISVLLFLASLGYGTYIYVHWDDKIEMEESVFQINLPVINWGKYLELSKGRE